MKLSDCLGASKGTARVPNSWTGRCYYSLNSWGNSLYCLLRSNCKSRWERITAFLLQVLYSLGREKSFHINPERGKKMKRQEKWNLDWRNFTIFINVFCSSWNISFISSGALSQASPRTQGPSGPCQKSSWGGSKAACIHKTWINMVAWIQVSLYHLTYSECYFEENGTARSLLNLFSIAALSQSHYKSRSLKFFSELGRKKLKVVSILFQISLQNTF